MSALEQPESGSKAASRPRPLWLRGLRWHQLAVLAAIAGVLVTAYATGWQRHLSFSTLVNHRDLIVAFVAEHRALGIIAFVALYAAVTAGAIPVGAVLAMIGGFLFGTTMGGLGAMVGSTIGATVLFAIARGALREPLMRNAGPRVTAFAAGFRADAFSYILFMRLMPTPSWLTSMASGALSVRLPIFMAATALGRTPGSFVFALFGAGLGGVISTQEAIYRACLASGADNCRIDIAPKTMLTPTLLAGLIALALLALVPVLAKRLLMRRAAPRPEGP